MSVLSASIQNNIKRFIYCSSMSRYGKQDTLPYTEDMICNPGVPYAVAKHSSEQIIKQLCEFNNMEYVIIVPHNIIGPRQCYTDPFRNVAAIMINRILKNEQPIIYGDGNQQRCFSFIDDVVDCLEKVFTQDNVSGEVINIGPDEEFVTINELAGKIAEIMDFDLDPIYMPGRPLELKTAVCSSDKARRLLDYSTKFSLEKGLTAMIDYMKEKGPKEFNYRYDIEIVNSRTPETWSQKLF